MTNPTTDPAPRRDPAGIVLGAGLTGVFGALAVYLCTLGALWPVAATIPALVALLGLYGTVTSIQRRERTR